MATPFSRQGKQPRKITLRQVLEQLEADDSDFGPELDSDSENTFLDKQRPMLLVFFSCDFGPVFLFPLAKVFVHLKSSSNMQQIKQKKKKKHC